MSVVFTARGETFGFETPDPWATEALRLLFSAPRVYAPLVEAWEGRFRGTRAAVSRLADMGFVNYQPGIIIDTRTGSPASNVSRRVPRYRTTSRGQRLVAAVREDIGVLEDEFPRTAGHNVAGLKLLLEAFNVMDSHAKYGMSVTHVQQISGLPLSTVKWWVKALREKRYVRELEEKYADVREVVPAHWRPNRLLARQLSLVLDEFPNAPQHLRTEFRLGRSRFLEDISPARVGISGATDYDHDVECQRIVADLLRSPQCLPEGVFAVEPKFALPANTAVAPWSFEQGGSETVFYQPDAQVRERIGGRVGRAVVEYERFQTRRDGWNHIERFLGFVATGVAFEPTVLRFVVDSPTRERGYVELIEAFADYALEHPERIPASPVHFAVSHGQRLAQVSDPLDASAWFTLTLAPGTAGPGGGCVVHPADNSPFDDYFTTG